MASVSSTSSDPPLTRYRRKCNKCTDTYSIVGTWFAFKKLFRRKAEKMEMTNLTYGAMARLCREGGFWVCHNGKY